MKRMGVVLVVAACGSSSSKTPDARVIDSRPIDTPVDMPAPDAYEPDAAEPVAGHYHYVVSKMTWPTTTTEARADGFDLDNNGTVDNQLGMVMASFTSQGFAVQPGTDREIATGHVIMLGDLGATDLTTDAAATFTLLQGIDPDPPACSGSGDTVCGHHLHGTGSFTVDPNEPTDPPLTGSIAAGTFTGGPGRLTIRTSLFGSVPVELSLLAAHAHLAVTAGGFMQGTIGGAIPEAEIQSQVYPGITAGFVQMIAQDCTGTNPPQCGCASGSTGATLISLFDTDHDCNITVTEVQNNSLIMSLFASDVTINNQPCLSVGFAAQAVDATFTP